MYRKTYKRAKLFRALTTIGFGLVLIPFLLLVVLFLTPAQPQWVRTLAFAFAGIVALTLLWWQWNYPQLVITDWGLVYHEAVYSIETSWSNIESYMVVGHWRKWGLWLKTPVPIKTHRFLTTYVAFYGAFLAAVYNFGDISRSIPIQPFGGLRWEQSDLMRDVKRHLPDLGQGRQ